MIALTHRQPAAEEHQRGGSSAGAARSQPEVVRIGLLGGFRLWVGPRLIEENLWRLRKAKSLIKLLALAPGHRLHREQVMQTLWPKLGVRKASNNLHQILHAARRTLEPSASASSSSAACPSSYLLLTDEQIRLCPDSALWVDVEAFEETALSARHASVEPHLFRGAIDLYCGELLPEDRYEGWVQERRAHLRELYLSLLLDLGALLEERREFREAIEAFGRVVIEEPTHEGAHVGLMRLYALLGRRREALSQYERLREALLRELDAEPEATTIRLQQQIWAGTFPHSDLSSGGFRPAEEAPSSAGGARHKLPLAPTSFIGRERLEAVTDYGGRLAAARSQLDERAWLEARVQGKSMKLDRAVEYTLSEEVSEPPTLVAVPERHLPADKPIERLTPREQEVALLVGGGLTNRQIALELSISDRTVEHHIGKILKKQGFSSRARIATWVAHR
jgi:DNA-binding SARP family transcriptional activator/DNA-binding CsgD family transcriptional regulator